MGLTSFSYKNHHAIEPKVELASNLRFADAEKIIDQTSAFSAPLREIFFLFVLLFSFSFLYAAENTLSLSSEIARLEKIGASSVSSQERHSAFLTLARLYQLSGNNEAALKALESALKINSGNGHSLLERGRLLISQGEYEKAFESLTAIFTGNYTKDILLEARFLVAQLEAFRSGNLSPLSALANDADFTEYRRLIYYTLWKIEQNPAWKALLAKDFPLSPEAKITAGKALSAQTPLWILFPGRDTLALTAPATPAPATPAPAATPTPTVSGVTVLQAGFFSREENARALAERINKAGFQSVIQNKQQKDGSYWVVYVPYGSDMNAMIKRLKDAGFESFPITLN
jgi:tetratricopeptide (TPR) repeat protein